MSEKCFRKWNSELRAVVGSDCGLGREMACNGAASQQMGGLRWRCRLVESKENLDAVMYK